MKEKDIETEIGQKPKEKGGFEADPVFFGQKNESLEYDKKDKSETGSDQNGKEEKPESGSRNEDIENIREKLEEKYKEADGERKKKDGEKKEGMEEDGSSKDEKVGNSGNYEFETEKEIKMRDNITDFHPEKVAGLLEELIADFKPVPERLDIEIEIENISVDKIEEFCEKNGDVDTYKKMMIHDIPKEHVENIIALAKKGGDNLQKDEMEKLLTDLGYNVKVLMSKTFGCDYDAATNIGGYSIPGWEKVVDYLRKYNNNLAVFFGKRFAPGKSRLHIHVYEGNTHTYVIPHIDEFNWINSNIAGVKKSHVGYGAGDTTTGNKYFLKSLMEYFSGK